MHFRLLEIKYKDNGRYPLDMLLAFLTPRAIRWVYTYPESSNNRSRKEPLPLPIFNAVIKVARIRLKNTKMTIEEFKEKLRHKFSSLKTKDDKVKRVYIYIYIYTS